MIYGYSGTKKQRHGTLLSINIQWVAAGVNSPHVNATRFPCISAAHRRTKRSGVLLQHKRLSLLWGRFYPVDQDQPLQARDPDSSSSALLGVSGLYAYGETSFLDITLATRTVNYDIKPSNHPAGTYHLPDTIPLLRSRGSKFKGHYSKWSVGGSRNNKLSKERRAAQWGGMNKRTWGRWVIRLPKPNGKCLRCKWLTISLPSTATVEVPSST